VGGGFACSREAGVWAPVLLWWSHLQQPSQKTRSIRAPEPRRRLGRLSLQMADGGMSRQIFIWSHISVSRPSLLSQMKQWLCKMSEGGIGHLREVALEVAPSLALKLVSFDSVAVFRICSAQQRRVSLCPFLLWSAARTDLRCFPFRSSTGYLLVLLGISSSHLRVLRFAAPQASWVHRSDRSEALIIAVFVVFCSFYPFHPQGSMILLAWVRGQRCWG